MMNPGPDAQQGHVMYGPDVDVDTERALSQIRERIERERLRPVFVTQARRVGRWDAVLSSMWTKTAAGLASIAVALTLLTVTGVAETIVTLFEPKQVVPVTITASDLAGIDGFARFGTLTWSTPPKPYDVPNAATAARESGLTVLVPSQLPAGVTAAQGRFGVMPRTTATFTFSADKASKSAAAIGRTPPPMPANIDGSKLFITGGPAVVQFYLDPSAPAPSSNDPLSGMPKLVIAQGKAPVVQSDGVTVEQLQQYLLAQPGISPSLAAQIKAIKDPSSTLPVPIPVDMATS